MLSLNELLKESDRLEPVPQVIHQLMDLVEDPEVPITEVTELILYEPVVTANLLKLANSAAFGFRRKIESVHDAIVLMGLKRVVELIMLNNVTKPLKSAQKGYELEKGQLWKQSVSCALMTSAIAEAVEAPQRHIVFTAALLKDIGILVLGRHIAKAAVTLRQTMDGGQLSLVDAERQVLGIDHAYLGSRIAANWNFGQTLRTTIQHHHLTDEITTISDETAMVYLADSMCSMSGINGELFCGSDTHYNRVCKQLGLSEAQVNRIMSDFYSRKENIYGLLSIL